MKQRLIDANKLRADICKWLKPSVPDETEMVAVDEIGVSVCMEIEEQPTVFEIPENPTNGDMIKAMFPDVKIHQSGGYTGCLFQPSVMLDDIRSEWWNAPYKKGEASE